MAISRTFDGAVAPYLAQLVIVVLARSVCRMLLHPALGIFAPLGNFYFPSLYIKKKHDS
jgi:hypothetical protein